MEILKHWDKKQDPGINFYRDLNRNDLLEYLNEDQAFNDFPFLLIRKELDLLHEWTNLYLDDIEFVRSGFMGGITKYCIQRQKRINGGF